MDSVAISISSTDANTLTSPDNIILRAEFQVISGTNLVSLQYGKYRT